MRATNLLVLMSDEHNPKFLGAAGHPFIATPNLDALAARGLARAAQRSRARARDGDPEPPSDVD